jgi:hypothetical protein
MRTSTRTALDRVTAQRDVMDTPGGTAAPPPWTTPNEDAADVPRWDRQPAHRGRLVLVAAVTAAVAIGAGTIVATHSSPTTPSPPATQPPAAPPADTPTTLEQLATTARSQPPPSGGTYSYVHTLGWFQTSSSLEGGPAFDVRTVRTDRQVWLDDTGAGRILSVAADRNPAGTFDDTTNPTAGGSQPTAIPTPPTPGGDATAELLAQYPDRTGAQWLAGMTDTWTSRAVDPPTQAALLTILAGRGDVTVGGLVTDRAGRTGITVTAEDTSSGAPTRHTLVLDPATGALLAAQAEQLAPGGMNTTGPFPAVVGYTAFLASARTTDTTTTVPVAPPVLSRTPAPPLSCAGGTATGFSASLAAGATGQLLPQEAADDRVLAEPTLGEPYQWQAAAGAAAGELTLSNGTTQLTVVQLNDGTWAVNGGSRCS